MTGLVKMTVRDVVTCSMLSWYEKFKKHTIKSIILPMPPDVLTYMKDQGTVVLPQGTQPEPSYCTSNGDSDGEGWDSCEGSEEGAAALAPNLEEFNKKITKAIEELGGRVFPKTNWSAPKDAIWIAFNSSLQCMTTADIYLVLKSSCFITHDLNTPFKDCADKEEAETSVDYCMILRQWTEINPAYEFRGYVKDKELIGISQRDVSQSYACIDLEKDSIRSDIISFWHEVIENRFPLDCYTFDVYRPAKDKVTLIDFNPLGVTTDALLFQWHELRVTEKDVHTPLDSQPDDSYEELCEDIEGCNIDSNKRCTSPLSAPNKPIFRFIKQPTGVQPSHLRQYGIPVDMLRMSSGEDPQTLWDFLELVKKGDRRDSDSSEEALGNLSDQLVDTS